MQRATNIEMLQKRLRCGLHPMVDRVPGQPPSEVLSADASAARFPHWRVNLLDILSRTGRQSASAVCRIRGAVSAGGVNERRAARTTNGSVRCFSLHCVFRTD